MSPRPTPLAVPWILAVAVLVTHVLGAGALRSSLWGASAYAFLPAPALVVACVLLGAAVVLGAVSGSRPDPVPSAPSARPRALWLGAAAGVAFLAFWWFREGHTLLGDGNSLIGDLPRGQRFHPHEPLTYFIHHWFYQLAGKLFQSETDLTEVARHTVALSSAIAGAAFIPVAWALARELVQAFGPDPEPSPDPSSTWATALVFLVLLGQGYVQLFFGYVENYTLSLLCLGVYLLAALRFLTGGVPLAAPGIALVVDIGLDLSSVLWIPSFLLLIARSVARRDPWPAAARDLIVILAAAAGLTAALAAIRPGYFLPNQAFWTVLQALIGHGGHLEGLRYMFSGEHLRDFLNEQMLIGPAALFLLATASVWLTVARPRLGWAGGFLLIAAATAAAGAWVTTDLGLGYARDWDLFAASGLVFTAAGLCVFLSSLAQPLRAANLRRALVLLVAASLFHTVPWVAVNASFSRSFARFKTLPMGLGRTEAVVGYWYLTHGDTLQAAQWFRQSLDANAANSLAAYCLGRIAMGRGSHAWAARAFAAALEQRPDKDEYRFALVDAMLQGEAPVEWIRPQVDTLLARNPREPLYWAASGVVRLRIGEQELAASDFARAVELAPGDTSLVELASRPVHPDGYLRALREDWPKLVR